MTDEEAPTSAPTTWETSVGSMAMRDDGIAIFVSAPGAVETLPGAKEVLEGFRQLGGGRPLLAIADIRQAQSVNRDARRVYASDEMKTVVRALALVVESGVSRLIGNFFLGFNRPKTELRLVGSIDEGVAWLTSLPADADG